MTLFDTLFAAQDLSRVLVLAMLAGIGVMIGGKLAKGNWNFLHPLLPGGVSGAFTALAVLLTLPLGQSPLTRWALTGLMLAGGLRPESVADIIQRVQPIGVDVSSGVECQPGVKDPLRIQHFVRAALVALESINSQVGEAI